MIYTQIRAFDAVAREGSFSRAADVLSLTQPALTLQVKALEARHGLKLLHRDGRGVRLTEAGERLFTLSRQLASLEEMIDDTLATSSEIQRGELRLAVDGPHIVMGLFAQFLARHPQVRLSVSMGNTQVVRQRLLDRHVDVGILPRIADHPRVHAVPLWIHRGLLITAHDHRLADRKVVSLTELEGEAMIGREDGSTTQALVDAAFARHGVKARKVLELGSREALVEAVAVGLGCGIVWELEALASSRVRAIPIENDELTTTDYIACLKSERERAIVKAIFAEAARMPGDRHDIAALGRS
jgi:aminoethylphosphonate catabolism LysR family transcriptional regulator